MKEKINLKALKWLSDVTGKKKIYILILIIIQAVLGFSGVIYALLLRNILDSAAVQNRNGFFQLWHR